jgi:hypothetical protein
MLPALQMIPTAVVSIIIVKDAMMHLYSELRANSVKKIDF